MTVGHQDVFLLLVSRWPWPGGDAPAASLADQTDAAKAAAADVLGALMAQPSHGPRVSLLMGKLLPPGLVASIAEGPPAAVLRALGQVCQ
jgi:DnaJ family protein C protein 13